MSQISQPVRIVLVVAVVFLAAWFTVLRPKSEAPAVPPPAASTTTTPSSGLARAAEHAKQAAKRAAGTASPTATTKPGVAAAAAPAAKPEIVPVAIPAAALATLPKDVARALEARHVLVLGVLADRATAWRPLADDDRSVRNALRHVNRYDGHVLVKPVPLARLSVYGSLVNDLGVRQSPSVVVIDRDLKGTVLTGYVDRVAINQAIADARRASIRPNLQDAYLRRANGLCGRYELRMTRWSRATVRGKKASHAALERKLKIVRDYRHGIERLPAPARWRDLKRDWVHVMTMRERTPGQWWAAVRKLDGRFDAAGLTECSIRRRS